MSDILDAAFTNPREGGATFSLRHRVFRGVWNMVWGGLGIWTPTPLHAWRRWLACLFGAQIDTTASSEERRVGTYCLSRWPPSPS